ncbi:hypothetical protein SAY87_011695 [Trapa incisa]|uniref:Myb/SANT-like DNA-binding domain-containing protein n=1 Tax=Trapa incisa TaxID=236973 RepID=A0AAN7GR62_9MYRT|nr:hypothetical protein SAY87_011695 [Trapa incisa]
MKESLEGSEIQRPSEAAPPTAHREDCWTYEATRTLFEAWCERYIGLNRGSLRQQHWEEVADAVNSRHGGDNPRFRRTDVQCKYRMDTLKKRYKVEKARVLAAGDSSYVSPWPFFSVLDRLIGPRTPAKGSNTSPPPPAASWHQSPFTLPAVPVRPRSFKRSAREHTKLMPFSDSGRVSLLRKYEPEREDSDGSGWRSSTGRREKMIKGSGELVRAIKRLGEVYERVERRKQREMVELEKQRMEFSKELEQQRMRWLVEMQVQLQKMEKIKKTSQQSSLAEEEVTRHLWFSDSHL